MNVADNDHWRADAQDIGLKFLEMKKLVTKDILGDLDKLREFFSLDFSVFFEFLDENFKIDFFLGFMIKKYRNRSMCLSFWGCDCPRSKSFFFHSPMTFSLHLACSLPHPIWVSLTLIFHWRSVDGTSSLYRSINLYRKWFNVASSIIYLIFDLLILYF